MIRYRLFTLGQLRLEPPATAALGGRRKELILLAYLARRSPRGVPRDELATLFWGEREDARARHSLRQALHRLKRVLGDDLQADGAVRLAAGAVELDATAFEEEIEAGRLWQAAERWRGDFLPGADDAGGEGYRAWLEAEREALRRKLCASLERLSRQAEERQALDDAVAWAERWADAAPYDEAAVSRLCDALRRAGRVRAAVDRYAAAVARLREEPGAEPSATFQVLGEELRRAASAEPRDAGVAALFTPDMVGRAAAFAELVAAWQSAEEGSGRVLLVEGEEGIGKTRLVQELVRWIGGRDPPSLLLHATGSDADRGAETATARRLLAMLPTAPGLAGAPDAALGELSGLLPTLRERFPQLPRPAGSESALVRAIREVLRDVGAEVPVLVLLDDFGAADAATQRLLLALVHDPPPHLLVLLTERSDAPGPAGPITRLQQSPALSRIHLRPLTEAEVEKLVGSMLALPPDDRYLLARRLHAEAQGNPLHIVEHVHALAEEGLLALDAEGIWRVAADLPARPLPLSNRIRDSTRRRLGRLDAGGQAVLEAAAVLAPWGDPNALEALADVAPEEFSAALDTLLSRRLLRESGSSPVGYAFSHRIVCRIVYEQLSPARRQALHRAALEALQRPGAAVPPESQPLLAYHRERAGPANDRGRRHRLRPAVAVAVLALLVAIGTGYLTRGRPAPSVSPMTVAVLPFSLQGSPELAYLREGIPTLLSTGLDGAAGLRVVDPHVLLAAAAREPGAFMDPQRGRALAGRFGAGLYVLGTITAAGGQLQVTASLYDGSGRLHSTVRAAVGGEVETFGLVDQLARQILAEVQPGAGRRFAGVAAATTTSLAALKAYFDGESELRAGRFPQAANAFARALAADSTFALASYRKAVAAEWLKDPDMEGESIERAMRHRARLPERDRWLVEAYDAGYAGAADEAERLFRAVLRTHPNDPVAWSRLGELLIHYNPMRGRPMAESRVPFERALALDPDDSEPLWHLAQLAATQGRKTALDSLVIRLGVGGEGAMWRLIGARLGGDPQAAASAREELSEDADEALLYLSAYALPLFLSDYGEGRRLAAILTDPGRPARWQAVGHLLAAQVELGAGRWRAARDALRSAERLDRGAALPYLGALGALPFLPLTEAELVALREELSAWDADVPLSSTIQHPYVEVHDPIRPHLRLYALGLLSARLDDRVAVERFAQALESRAGSPGERRLADDLALGIRSRALLGQGRVAEALAQMERAHFAPQAVVVSLSPFYSHALERFTRAELLHELERNAEAAGWYASVAESPPFGFIFRAPAHLRQGEIHERLGNPGEAARHYARMVELWQDCDPELLPLVDEARRRLARLEAASGR